MLLSATISSSSPSSSSCRSTPSFPNSSMPSLRQPPFISHPYKQRANPDSLTSFDASHFIFDEHSANKASRRHNPNRLTGSGSSRKHPPPALRRYHSHDSHYSNESPIAVGEEQLEHDARDFLERYSLPRVVRVGNGGGAKRGEPLLLYRCFDNFTKVQARAVIPKRNKELVENSVLHFPEGYMGWFSLINDKGERSAVMHTTILHLVREQVCSFLSTQPFTAYASHVSDLTDGNGRIQYLKTQVKAGQLFQLRAVFQHKDRSQDSARGSSRIARNVVRDKDLANRYAQLVSQTNQELYVPLTTKGEFYEIHSSMKARLCFPGMLDKTGPLALDRDCLYRLNHLLRRIALPVKVKLITGPLPPDLPKDFPDTFILEKKFQEPMLVTCSLPNGPDSPPTLGYINLNSSSLKLARSTLGFDSESRLFKSQRLQTALAFCHKHCDQWYRQVRLAANLQQCHDNLPPAQHTRVTNQEHSSSLPPTRSKWFMLRKIWATNGAKTDGEKIAESPLDRYKDMSKLIEDKFGRGKSYNPVKKSASFMFQNKRVLEQIASTSPKGLTEETPTAVLLKCQSLDSVPHKESLRIQPPQSLPYELVTQLPSVTELHIEDLTTIDEPNKYKMERKLKSKPDLIPTLPKQTLITDRLCSEFHVKCKKLVSSQHHITDQHTEKMVTVQVHENYRNRITELDLDVPYVQVADEIAPPLKDVRIPTENIYAEICEHPEPECDQHNSSLSTTSSSGDSLNSKRTPAKCGARFALKGADPNAILNYCSYIKLSANGDSVLQSNADEALYNSLR